MLAPYPATRLRRFRKNEALRELSAEHRLSASDLIQPLFFVEGSGPKEPISSMPGQYRWSEQELIDVVKECANLQIPAVALFPKIADARKTVDGAAAWDPEGLVPRVIRTLKEKVPEVLLIADIALDPFSSLGQDGIVRHGQIANDETCAALVRQALCYAAAGADMVAPSDMMDGRIGTIRSALENAGYTDTLILSYSAKYASAFYGPFRDALDSAPRGGADKKTYQMDPRNGDEALGEAELDLTEGADWLMVKPGLPYLDIVWRIKERYKRPLAAYHVSGEYAMVKAAAANGWLNERAVVLESLTAFKRAGADAIFTYFAMDAARWLRER